MQDQWILFLVTYLLSLISWTAHAQVKVENNAPVVTIIKPMAGEALHRNTLVPYAINVNDAEDGNSAYEEIADREVILVVKYLEGSSLVKDYLARIDLELVPLIAMSKSTCLNCHAASDKLIGPSFDLIAKKYGANENAKTYLTEKVIRGSAGIWGEVKMPPHPDLTKEEADLIVDWILKQEDDPTQFYVGLEGAIRIQAAPTSSDKKFCVLTAAYEDHGLTYVPKNQKPGRQTMVLKIRH